MQVLPRQLIYLLILFLYLSLSYLLNNLTKKSKSRLACPILFYINIIKNIIEKSINGDNLILIAIDEENIVGFLSAQKGEYKRIKHTDYIVVGIREKYRGKGIGSKLFSELDTWAIENKITRLELSVICSNTIAKHLYEKNGFKVEGIKKNAMIIDGKYVDEFFMAKIYNS